MEKVVKDGKVAVLISPGYGAGWYTWNTDYPELLFHPKIVELVEQQRNNEITEEWVEENLKISIYTGGACDLEIVWLPVGTNFRINEYDGHESLLIDNDLILTA